MITGVLLLRCGGGPTGGPGNRPGGGGTRLSFGRGGGVPLGGRKPVSNRSAHKKYTLSQYTLLKLAYICIPCTGTDGLSILLCIIIHS